MNTYQSTLNGNDERVSIREEYKDEEWLRERYLEREHSIREVADCIEASVRTVANWIAKFNIDTRERGESQTDGDLELVRDEEWLREQYWELERTMAEMADISGVSTNTIKNWLHHHEIETRSRSDGNAQPLRDESWLRTQYVEKNRSMTHIADNLGVVHTTVRYWLNQHGIERRYGHTDPDHLDHAVDSGWELEIANLLHENGISYENESMTVRYTTLMDWDADSGRTHTHRPDFVTEDYVIEVKGRNFGKEHGKPGTAERKARAVMSHLDEKEYVVVGIELPCDHHYSHEDREDLLELF